jgi:glutathione S-transferase
MRQPTLKQLRYLVALSEVGHFGRAAKACFVSQSAFSAAIQELEGLLGTQLIDRTNRQVTISPFAVVGWAWRHPRHRVDLADFPHVQRWYRVMMARPGVARGFAVPLRRG